MAWPAFHCPSMSIHPEKPEEKAILRPLLHLIISPCLLVHIEYIVLIGTQDDNTQYHRLCTINITVHPSLLSHRIAYNHHHHRCQRFRKVDTSCLKCAHEGIAELVENPPGLDVANTLNLPCTASRKTIAAPTGGRAAAIPVAKSRCPKQFLESFFTTLDWINRWRCISGCESMRQVYEWIN